MVPFRLEFLENSNNVFFFDQIPTEKVEVDGDFLKRQNWAVLSWYKYRITFILLL